MPVLLSAVALGVAAAIISDNIQVERTDKTMTTQYVAKDFPPLKNDLLLRAARGTSSIFS